MRARTCWGLTALVLLAAFAPALPSAAHQERYNSRTTVTTVMNGPNWTVSGDVRSGLRRCVRNRTIRVYNTTNGADDLVATATSARNGEWTTTFNGVGMTSIEIRLLRKRWSSPGHDHICKGAAR